MMTEEKFAKIQVELNELFDDRQPRSFLGKLFYKVGKVLRPA